MESFVDWCLLIPPSAEKRGLDNTHHRAALPQCSDELEKQNHKPEHTTGCGRSSDSAGEGLTVVMFAVRLQTCQAA